MHGSHGISASQLHCIYVTTSEDDEDPFLSIHQIAKKKKKKDFPVREGNEVWDTYKITSDIFTPELLNYAPLVPVVTANGKEGFRLWLFGIEGHKIRGFSIRLRPDGSIDSLPMDLTPQDQLEVDSSQIIPTLRSCDKLKATCLEFARSRLFDALVLMWKNEGPEYVVTPINADGTIQDVPTNYHV
jgi:hypothetical protein